MGYKTNTQKNQMFEVKLPSSDGQYWVKVPTRLGLGARKRILEESYELHLSTNGESDEPEEMLMLSPAKAQYELVVAALLDSRTFHNLDDDDGKPVEITRRWIDHELDENDGLYLGQMFMYRMWNQIGLDEPPPAPVNPETGVSAEGESDTSRPPKSTKRSRTTEKSGSSSTPEASR